MKPSELISQPLAMRTDRYIGMGPAYVNGNDAWSLICSCVDGDVGAAVSLLDGDADLVNVQYWYETPLHFAVREGQVDLARLLIVRGADPTTSCYGADAWARLLELAEMRDHCSMAALLISEMSQRFRYSPDFAPVAEAVRAYDVDRLGRLLDKRPELLGAADAIGNGVVHWAAMTHQAELIEPLRERGADLDLKRADGRTPTLLTIHGDYGFRWWRDVPEERRRTPQEILEALLDAGAERPFGVAVLQGDHDAVRRTLERRPGAANGLDSGRTSPLCYASLGGRAEMTALLLAHGAAPNQPEALAPHGRALYEAAARNQLEQARLLLEAGADPDAAVDSSGNCLYLAVTRHPDDSAAMVDLLHAHGAQTATWQMSAEELRRALQKGTPLDDPFAGEEGLWTDVVAREDLRLLELLIERRPDTPALLSGWDFRPGHPEFVLTKPSLDRLIACGFDIHRRDWKGATLLHYCAEFDDMELAADLLERGADIDAVDQMHCGTALATAARCGHLDIVAFLLAQGADPGIPLDRDWARPHAQAERSGHRDIAELLASR